MIKINNAAAAGKPNAYSKERMITIRKRASLYCGSHATGRSVDGDELTLDEGSRAGGCAHHRWDAVLAGDNCGVRGWPTRVDDHGGGALEQGCPGRFCVRADQDLAGHQTTELRRLVDHPDGAGR